MLGGLAKSIFGSANDRYVKSMQKVVDAVNSFEPSVEVLSDEELAAKTPYFKERVANGETLDDILPEAFAVVREAAKRTLGQRHYDVQLIGGIVLHRGEIAEMRTGEGKTLVATLACYLNAIDGKGVHVVTVNDYLARRDAEWMSQVYTFLGLEVGVIVPNIGEEKRRAAYAADITYGTNNEFGFDYLRDNMKHERAQMVQRPFNFAIVDEVDSILIDEARTPLIISGPTDDKSDLYMTVNAVVQNITEEDYEKDEKSRNISLTEEGTEKAERLLEEAGLLVGSNLYDFENTQVVHHLNQALMANVMRKRDTDYIVKDGKIVIIDEFTGRMMDGRRWSNGLHQAVEAKEGVEIQRENQTLASITFQNYFRMYKKLAGMTGTADTEAYEFQEIYGLETVVIPTNQPMIRKDMNDLVYRTGDEKWKAVIADIADCHKRGQPVLVGTTSIEINEFLSERLKKAGLPHQVLNAKQHAQEAQVIAQAGLPGGVTIATNMAGRGTDIVLGGSIAKEIDANENDAALTETDKAARLATIKADWQKLHDVVLAAGGLHIIGTERHESRRVDNQLRGRSGRQGDPGSSRFYLSLEDSLLRIFGGDRLGAIMERLKMPEGEAIEHGMVNRSLESAQRKVEQRNFDIRKQLLEYDDVANDQRRVIYSQRNELLETSNIAVGILNMHGQVLNDLISEHIVPGSMAEQWDVAGLERVLASEYLLQCPIQHWLDSDDTLDEHGLRDKIIATARATYAEKEVVAGDNLHQFEHAILLQTLDGHWREHLAAMDHLRQGIHLRGYAAKNPKQEYKREAFDLFETMLSAVAREVTRVTLTVQIRAEEDVEAVEAQEPELSNVHYHHADFDQALAGEDEAIEETAPPQPIERQSPKVGRNDPCPCGSGKKYKHCHGQLN